MLTIIEEGRKVNWLDLARMSNTAFARRLSWLTTKNTIDLIHAHGGRFGTKRLEKMSKTALLQILYEVVREKYYAGEFN